VATLLERVRKTAERARELEQPLREAIVERDAAILAAHAEGIPAARIAREAGLSRQRVHEIVKSRSGK
jgi:DNA-binding phage protein